MATKNKRMEMPEFDKPLELKVAPIPEAPPEGAVIKVHFAGICHSDVHVIFGGSQTAQDQAQLRSLLKRPLLLGHEISGEIYKLGSKADVASYRYKVGDRVMVYPWVGCGQCGFCKAGENLFCMAMLLCSHGIGWEGGFQQYMPVNSLSYLIAVPTGMPMDMAALIPCSGITAYSGIMKAKPAVEKFSKCMGEVALLIAGAGGVGLWGIQIARAVMPKNTKIYVAEIAESKFQLALDSGADQCILWDLKATTEEKIALTKAAIPEGVFVIVDFVGSDGTVQTTSSCLGKGGTIVTVGIFKGTYTFNSSHFALNMLNLQGSLTGTKSDVAGVAKLVAAGKITGPPMAHVTLEETNQVLDELKTGTRRGRALVRQV